MAEFNVNILRNVMLFSNLLQNFRVRLLNFVFQKKKKKSKSKPLPLIRNLKVHRQCRI